MLLSGDRFGHLIALKRYSSNGGHRWSCWCDCGRFLVLQQSLLLQARRTSCGHCDTSAFSKESIVNSPFSPNYKPKVQTTDLVRDARISASRSQRRQADLRSSDPHVREAAAGHIGALSNRSKGGGQ